MNVRALKKSDITFLLSSRKDFPDLWNEDMLNSAFRAGNFYGFIAEERAGGKNLPIGFITFSVCCDTADLQDLFVKPDFRKKGVAKALVSAFENDTCERGVKKLFLEVRESNAPAIALYLSGGFKQISVRKKYYSDGENALVLSKEL